MSSIWLPGLVVLAVGLGAGAWAALRLRRGARKGRAADLRLAVADLEARRDELYARLRGATGERLEGNERRAAELAAARILRDLDQHGARLESAAPAPRHATEAASGPGDETGAAVEKEPRRGFASRHPALVGFAAGMVTVGLIGILIYWAGRDATPRPEENGAGLPPDHPAVSDELPAELEERLVELERRLAADSGDIMARKELALTELSAGRAFDAFRHAEEILRQQPDDPDGLFIQGVVKLSMGQTAEAVDLLDRVLARFPDHLQALVYRGVALARGGETDRAVDSWQMALELVGGRSPEIENLIASALEGGGQQPLAAAPPGSEPAPQAAPQLSQQAAPQPGDPSTGFTVTVDLAPGAMADPRATLFVSLRPAETGPPVAVRRVVSPRFPLRLVLGEQDSMMGQPLPESGFLSARLDLDGSASTRNPEDLEAASAARIGGEVRLLLARP